MSSNDLESKYKIGKVKRTASVLKNEKTGLSYIVLQKRENQKVYGCTRFANNYKEEKKLGQGTFGEVYKGVHLGTQKQVAIKRILINAEKDLFPITAQREITILRRLNHNNVIKLIEMVYDYPPSSSSENGSNYNAYNQKGQQNIKKSFYMILPYMVADLSGLLHNPRINLEMSEIKNMMLQMFEGLNYIHCQKYMHRDIKAANILIDHNGILKIADFGLARIYYGSPPNLIYPGGAASGAKYTSVVVTRWYRAPELVLGDKYYTTAVDIWGIGCVFAEFFEKKPILQGKTDVDQGHVIFKLLGTPTEEEWSLASKLPGAELTKTNYKETISTRFGKYLTEKGLDFMKSLLKLDPYKRLTAMSAVKHDFFKEEPLPCKKLNLLCEESHEADIKRYKEEQNQAMSQRVPTAPPGHITEPNNKTPSKPGSAAKKDINDESFPKAPIRQLKQPQHNQNPNPNNQHYKPQKPPHYPHTTYPANMPAAEHSNRSRYRGTASNTTPQKNTTTNTNRNNSNNNLTRNIPSQPSRNNYNNYHHIDRNNNTLANPNSTLSISTQTGRFNYGNVTNDNPGEPYTHYNRNKNNYNQSNESYTNYNKNKTNYNQGYNSNNHNQNINTKNTSNTAVLGRHTIGEVSRFSNNRRNSNTNNRQYNEVHTKNAGTSRFERDFDSSAHEKKQSRYSLLHAKQNTSSNIDKTKYTKNNNAKTESKDNNKNSHLKGNDMANLY